ncbi:DNA mismatch repair protein MutT [Aureimonas endophytica]|uniref:DNA mismatch repair protein MutT n=1 Tax=Aureimonas endophytica TaxID=2027858 RepID=A0A916ZHS7_9HYPH|nr:NUDIX domain-containing protein [Aureimonas endophytica]GGD96813.1 DNA mismatch repair protein MutT [Aureimonas endophytica]
MSVWRPPSAVRVKVVGLLLDGPHLFAAEVTDDAGRVKGARPLGGSVEFGETREAALIREFREELGAEIALLGPWRVFENIFTHEGQPGHEIVFAAPIRLLDRVLPKDAAIVFHEADGTEGRARWFAIDEFRGGAPALYPQGLLGALARSEE